MTGVAAAGTGCRGATQGLAAARRRGQGALAGLLLGLWLGAGAGCGADRFVVVGTPEAPTTSGYIEVEDDDAGAWTSVFMHHLHPPDRLAPGLTCYILWFQPRGGEPQRVGALVYYPDERKGKLKGRRPAGPFTILITAEKSQRPAAPTGLLVAEQQITDD